MDTDTIDGLQAALGHRYRIEREIGRGGMATVYLAEDAEHQRMVALKILHRELAAVVGPKRFRREIAIAAQLQHPHILPLLDSGEEPGGVLWFAMPYVEGESLRERLNRERQLPLGDALRITREIATALEYAHQRRVIHRDVKPENILLSTDGNVLLADFGVARDLLNFPGTSGEHRLTDTGLSIGTLEYMSPEQAAGRRDIDARSDVYSLGCVLYEMLAGEPPYTGATPQALVARRLVERPLPLRSVRDRIPARLEQAVDIALARVAADRFASAGEFAAALDQVELDRAASGVGVGAGVGTGTGVKGGADAVRLGQRSKAAPSSAWSEGAVAAEGSPITTVGGWAAWFRARPLIATVSLGALAMVGLLFAWDRWRAAATTNEPARIAVMPFDGSSDSLSGIFAGGVTDAVRAKLSALPGLQVIARGSSLPYAGSPKTPQVIAQELGVRYVLTGHVRSDGTASTTTSGVGVNPGAASGRVRVRAQLVEVGRRPTPTVVWEAPFDADLSNVFQVESQVATQVASALGIPIDAVQRQQLAEQPTHNLDAYGAYLQGEARRSGANPVVLHQRVRYYSRAVSLDSTFGAAWAALSIAHSGLFYNSTPTVAEATAAADALSRAQELIPGHPETQVALATYEMGVHRDNVRARAAAEAGLATAPTNVDLLYTAASTERSSGAWPAALQHAQKAQNLDPRSVRATEALGTTYLYLRRYHDARAAYERALSLDPQATGIYEFLALARLGQGDLAGTQDVLRRGLAHVDTTEILAFFAGNNDLFWLLNDAQQRRMLTFEPVAFDGDRGAWGLVRAETYWLRGDTARARLYADTAHLTFAAQLRESEQDDLLWVVNGLALAYLGRKDAAIAAGERGVSLAPVSKDAVTGLYDEQVLARIYLMVGEPDKAVAHLDTLLRLPSFVSAARLRLEPTWAPLHGNAAFERLTGGAVKSATDSTHAAGAATTVAGPGRT